LTKPPDGVYGVIIERGREKIRVNRGVKAKKKKSQNSG